MFFYLVGQVWSKKGSRLWIVGEEENLVLWRESSWLISEAFLETDLLSRVH